MPTLKRLHAVAPVIRAECQFQLLHLTTRKLSEPLLGPTPPPSPQVSRATLVSRKPSCPQSFRRCPINVSSSPALGSSCYMNRNGVTLHPKHFPTRLYVRYAVLELDLYPADSLFIVARHLYQLLEAQGQFLADGSVCARYVILCNRSVTWDNVQMKIDLCLHPGQALGTL